MNRRKYKRQREADKRRLTATMKRDPDDPWLSLYQACLAGELRPHRGQQKRPKG
jgi:hypothetical protein